MIDRNLIAIYRNATKEESREWLKTHMPVSKLNNYETAGFDERGRYRWRLALHPEDQRVLFYRIDSLLNLSQPSGQTEVDMVALLRYTYSVRHHLTCYHIYLDAVAQELLRRGKDVEKILQGLPFYSIDRYP